MLQNKRLSTSTRTEPNFFSSESFPWPYGVSKWLFDMAICGTASSHKQEEEEEEEMAC